MEVSAPRHVDESRMAGDAGRTVDTAADHLELAEVLEVSRAVSGDLTVDRLVEAVLRTALEHGGAERGVLLLRSGELRMQGEATTTDRGEVTVTRRDQPFGDCSDVP
jgi:hypothetical protein